MADSIDPRSVPLTVARAPLDGEKVVYTQEDGTEMTEADIADEIVEAARLGPEHDDYLATLVKVRPDLINYPDEQGRTALHMAVANGHASTTAFLLANGANVSAKTASGATPLHWAVSNGNVDAVRVLLAAKAPVDALTVTGESAIELLPQVSDLEAAAQIHDVLISAAPEDPSGDTVDTVKRSDEVESDSDADADEAAAPGAPAAAQKETDAAKANGE